MAQAVMSMAEAAAQAVAPERVADQAATTPAELLACAEGNAFAIQWTLLPIEVKTDCTIGVQLLYSKKDHSKLAYGCVRSLALKTNLRRT